MLFTYTVKAFTKYKVSPCIRIVYPLEIAGCTFIIVAVTLIPNEGWSERWKRFVVEGRCGELI